MDPDQLHAKIKDFLASLKSLFIATRYTGASAKRNYVVSGIAYISSVLFLVTVIFLLTHTRNDAETKESARPFLILWTVLPPVWFWVEHHLIWETAHPDQRGKFETFKHSQEVSRNIWLAFVAILAGLYFK